MKVEGILSPGKPLPLLFDSEEAASAALAEQLTELLYPSGAEKFDQQFVDGVARQIVRNVAAMVLED